MKFQIKCATFVRLASICGFFESTTPPEVRERLNTVRLEIVNGRVIAIVTNQKVAAIELIGYTIPNEYGVAHIILDPLLISRCKTEAISGGELVINTIPEIAAASAQTLSGWVHQGNACQWFPHPELDEWRLWAPDEIPKKSEHIMAWNLYHVQALLDSSPTGKVIFPRYIDATKPIVLRDETNANWVGLFMAKLVDNNSAMPEIGAELPDWWSL